MQRSPLSLLTTRSSWTIWISLCFIALIAWSITMYMTFRMSMMGDAMGMGSVAGLVEQLSMPGTMGMALPEFLLFWLVMMAAMMLPSFAPTLNAHRRTLQEDRIPPAMRGLRLALVVTAYLVLWLLVGVPIFFLARWGATLLQSSPPAALYLCIALFVVAGVSQLTPLSSYCLSCCNSASLVQRRTLVVPVTLWRIDRRRAPVSYSLLSGLRCGLHCLGCCGGLMLLFIPLGLMNLPWMAVIMLVALGEKSWRHGQTMSRIVGYALFFFGLFIWIVPSFVPILR